ncbi:MAG: hypothetical protein A6F71_08595 [Cycloclasticus sp. symbiont of Poecilosclerida sp. M]|nr:MAG: hypothetical protein A6F71_08595 [Cycloclasticus sp. symbiont of Poecilosclerida sp. M]
MLSLEFTKAKEGLPQKCASVIQVCNKDAEQSDQTKAVKLLEKDLINGPFHCFGHHSKCSPDFCKTARDTLAPHLATPSASTSAPHLATPSASSYHPESDEDDTVSCTL